MKKRIILSLFLFITLFLCSDRASAVEVDITIEGGIAHLDFEECDGKYNGCTLFLGYEFSVYKDGKIIGKTFNSFTQLPSEEERDWWNTWDWSELGDQIKTNPYYIEKISEKTGVKLEDIKKSPKNYEIIVEPYFSILWDSDYSSPYSNTDHVEGTSKQIYSAYPAFQNYNTYSGLHSVIADLACTIYISDIASSCFQWKIDGYKGLSDESKKKFVESYWNLVNSPYYARGKIKLDFLGKSDPPGGDDTPPTTYTLKIQKKNDAGDPVSSTRFDYLLSKNADGSSPVRSCSTGKEKEKNSSCTMPALETGTYYLFETIPSSAQTTYEKLLKCDGCVDADITEIVPSYKYAVKVKISGDKTVTLYNERSCTAKLADFGDSPTRTQLLGLWNEYRNFNGLLKFGKDASGKPLARCEAVTCSSASAVECLSVSYSSISEDDWSCAAISTFAGKDETKITSKVFCGIDISLNPSDSYKSQVSKISSGVKSGQLYFDVLNGKIMSGTVSKTCYSTGAFDKSDVSEPKISDYLTSVKLTYEGKDVSLSSGGEKSEPASGGPTDDGVFTLTQKKSIGYFIPEVWVEKITGMQCDKSKTGCISLGYGILSKFSDKEKKDYSFSVELNNGAVDVATDDGTCSYTSDREIITPPPGEPDSPDKLKLNMEFRVISKSEPFTNKAGEPRNTKTNWCLGTGYRKLNVDPTKADDSETIQRYDLARWALVAYNVPIDLEKKYADYSIKMDVTEETINWREILTAANTKYNDSKYIVEGDTYGNYHADWPTTLAEFVTVVKHMVEYNKADPAAECGGHIDTSGLSFHWGRSAIEWAANRCMFEGTSYVRPLDMEDANAPITEKDAIKIIKNSMEDCSSDNPVVTEHILNANDSYNSTGAGPIYTINLTPSDIKDIREDFKTMNYDSGETLSCDSVNSCTSTYLNKLVSNGILIRH